MSDNNDDNIFISKENWQKSHNCIVIESIFHLNTLSRSIKLSFFQMRSGFIVSNSLNHLMQIKNNMQQSNITAVQKKNVRTKIFSHALLDNLYIISRMECI